MNATMDVDKFKDGIREALCEALAEKEDAKRLSKLEELVKEAEGTIQNLTEVIGNKEEELASASDSVDELNTAIEELKAKYAELEEKLSAAAEEKKTLEERAAQAESKLASIEAEKRLAGRMRELEEAKVLAAADARQAQEDRVKEMSDEEFTAYKAERVELRNQLEVELKAAAEKASQSDSGNKDDEVQPDNKDTASEDDGAAAAAATLNIEVASVSLRNKYKKLGEAMAERIKNRE